MERQKHFFPLGEYIKEESTGYIFILAEACILTNPMLSEKSFFLLTEFATFYIQDTFNNTPLPNFEGLGYSPVLHQVIHINYAYFHIVKELPGQLFYTIELPLAGHRFFYP